MTSNSAAFSLGKSVYTCTVSFTSAAQENEKAARVSLYTAALRMHTALEEELPSEHETYSTRRTLWGPAILFVADT